MPIRTSHPTTNRKKHMTTNRSLYNTVVSDVESDYAHVFEYEEGAVVSEDGEYSTQYEVLNALPLNVPTDTFSNLIVRDALMAKANLDDKFAFVLCNKIIHQVKAVSDNGSFVQADLDALAMAIHVQTMWEHLDNAINLVEIAELHAEKDSLKMPSLMEASKRIIMMNKVMGMEIAPLREKMSRELNPLLQSALDE